MGPGNICSSTQTIRTRTVPPKHSYLPVVQSAFRSRPVGPTCFVLCTWIYGGLTKNPKSVTMIVRSQRNQKASHGAICYLIVNYCGNTLFFDYFEWPEITFIKHICVLIIIIIIFFMGN